MATCKVWFNKPLSSIYSVFQLVREADQAQHYELYCTHPRPGFIGSMAAHHHEVEPQLIDDAEYLEFALGFCRRHGIGLFVPTHRVAVIAAYRKLFQEIGVAVVAPATAEVLLLLADKAALYGALNTVPGIVPVPEFAVATNKAEFDAATARIWDAVPNICVKPTVSMYGLGFRKLVDEGSELRRMMSGDVSNISHDQLRKMMAAEECFPAMMVMQYLEGVERSVDCLAIEGKLLTCVIRKKSLYVSGEQVLEENEVVASMAEKLTAHFGLNGLFNIQFKDGGETPYLLEINTRMSGGLSFTALSGLNLPYWFLRTAESNCDIREIPRPRLGIRYAQYTACVEVGQ